VTVARCVPRCLLLLVDHFLVVPWCCPMLLHPRSVADWLPL
jgi:hypothetical protein